MKEPFEKLLSEEEWYDTARAKIESFIRKIDPDLDVSLTPVIIYHKEGKECDTLALSFDHKKNPDLNWTMEIRKDFEYIDNKLEEVIRKIYEERKKEA